MEIMVIFLLTLNTVMASSIALESTFSDVPSYIEDLRDLLLTQISCYRQERMASRSTNDEDCVLLYSFGEIPRIDSPCQFLAYFIYF